MPQPTDPIERLGEELRVRVGSPDEAELGATELRRFLAMALDNLNRDQPARGLGQFTTVADQSAYDVVPRDAYRILDVFYYPTLNPDACCPLSEKELLVGEQIAPAGVAPGVRLFDHPSLLVAFEKKMVELRRATRGTWERTIDDGFLYLTPTPGEARVVWFVFLKPRHVRVEDVTKWYEPYLMLRAEVYALQALANKRSNVVSGSGPSGNYRTGGGDLQLAMARDKLREYEEQFRNLPVGPRFG